jgi:hypothetical protein
MTRRRPGPPSRRRTEVVTGAGIIVNATTRHNARIPLPPDGQHLWCNFAVFLLAHPDADSQLMDLENLITIEGPGCLICELPWDPVIDGEPCMGDRSSVHNP